MVAQRHGRQKKNEQRVKLDHGRVRRFKLAALRPAPENDRLYRRADPSDPEIVELAKSIKKYGVKEPLVISKDQYIPSGHRRHCAAKLVGLKTMPCRMANITWSKSPDRFLTLLREYNRQRDKSRDEKLREEIVSANPDEAYASLIEHRQEKLHLNDESCIKLRGPKERSEISPAKMPFLKAITAILRRLRDYWPLSDRRIHYVLLNDPPLRHASKPNSIYENTPQSYKSLTELLTRARLAGYISMEAIADETRPVAGGYAEP